MTSPRRRLGPGPRLDHDQDQAAELPADGAPVVEHRVLAAEADLGPEPLYRPDIPLDELRARGVLGAGPEPDAGPAGAAAPRRVMLRDFRHMPGA
ncbi:MULTISPECIES: hypothetical protein [Streptomyces]|uniref:Uncharacterized protein n=1 Tax=Streptomyces tsukubensis (strain DSM 42081 / NBRC 108919 / NRRL 18488 / 9993) TaxID=1114943 RepID=I2MT22_STRT9|nr:MULTISPECIES: hypothetical protein [Streptomyces]EIF87919.1 hypothetical protein [Streptomyces tsukubensis NRRL18488]MYS65131.1 hypothetical protein [Streptomyces sp. SID5473]QKM65776.1 hypothetical protein STSU_000020 [Streptomyces tsukubensis NRRL18488]